MLAGIQDLLNFNIHILRSWALTIYDHRILEKPVCSTADQTIMNSKLDTEMEIKRNLTSRYFNFCI